MIRETAPKSDLFSRLLSLPQKLGNTVGRLLQLSESLSQGGAPLPRMPSEAASPKVSSGSGYAIDTHKNYSQPHASLPVDSHGREALGTIACMNGQVAPVIKEGLGPVMSWAVRRHEYNHIVDLVSTFGNVCQGQRNGVGVTMTGYLHPATEVEANLDSYHYLSDQLQRMSPKDPEYEDVKNNVQNRLSLIREEYLAGADLSAGIDSARQYRHSLGLASPNVDRFQMEQMLRLSR